MIEKARDLGIDRVGRVLSYGVLQSSTGNVPARAGGRDLPRV